MDKQSSKRTVVTKEEGGSNSHEISANERQWLQSLEKNRDYLHSLRKPKIQMVPKMHRMIESNVRFYEPLVVSIGPFHYGKSKLQLMEKHKKLLAIQFADDQESREGVSQWLSTNSVSLEELYKKVKDIMPNVKKCYAEDSIKDYNNEEFTQMMLLDGCFILQYFHCIVTGNYKELKMQSRDIAFIHRDIFLLENQLPFEVLDVLMRCKFKHNEGMGMIKMFFSIALLKPPQHEGFIQSIKDFFSTKDQSTKNLLPAHLLELLKTNLINPKAFSVGGPHTGGNYFSYRSAMELRRAGIRFRPGKSRHLSEVKFTSFHCSALLTLPPITIDDSTKSQFLNLVAYESCADTSDDFGITSYISFMDSLIDHAEDVKMLRSKGILLNFLGSDQEVADLFNELARDLVPNPYAFVYVKGKIEKYCNSKGKI